MNLLTNPDKLRGFEKHIKVGIEALKLVRRHGRSVKHLRFEDMDDSGD